MAANVFELLLGSGILRSAPPLEIVWTPGSPLRRGALTMSYTTHESLGEIIETLKKSLPGLTKLLHQGGPVEVLHPAVEMLSSLIARYDRGEIVEKK
jgi:hypothetical protein